MRSGSLGRSLLRAALLLPLAAADLSAQTPDSYLPLLEEARAAEDAGQYTKALGKFEAAAAAAEAAGDQTAVADATRRSGAALHNLGRYDEAETRLQDALQRFRAMSDRRGEALALGSLGSVAWARGRMQDARALYTQSLTILREIGAREDQPAIIHKLLFVVGDRDEEQRLQEEGLAIAREVGDRRSEALIHHAKGDRFFTTGDYVSALDELNAAAAGLTEVRALGPLANVYTSLGRLHRSHGRPRAAMDFYRKAYEIQQAREDAIGQIQTLNATGVAYAYLGDHEAALRCYLAAAELARKTGSPRLINFMRGAEATAYANLGRHEEARVLLEQAVREETQDYVKAYREDALAVSLLYLGQPQRALELAHAAIDRTERIKDAEGFPVRLTTRAYAYEALGRLDEAAADASRAVALLEERRQMLVPSDYLKRGYSDWYQWVHGINIQLLERKGDAQEALLAAEQARARALLDLLAAQAGRPPAPAAPSTPPPAATALTLPSAAGEFDLLSAASRPAASFEELRATAQRLRSTVLSYWVGPRATLVWAMGTDGTVNLRKVPITERALTALVQATRPRAAASAGPTRGGDLFAGASEPEVAPTQRLDDLLLVTRGRGRARLVLDDGVQDAFRRLYSLLVEPVAAWLPAGGRLTIVPHGPLFALPFAALRDGSGKYLVERYALHYAPSLSVLGAAAARASRSQGEASFLIVADPASAEADLPRLPAARREAAAIAALAPAGAASVLTDATATEPLVRQQLQSRRVIHFASHSIVNDRTPLDSFVALAPGSTESDGDGRLTAGEIYGLHLGADLIVLSACRSASGQITGDGMLGLTRALLSAGASSVVATLWDVADEPTAALMPAFYRSWLAGNGKDDSLREAQLRLLRDLRAGRVEATTAIGRVTLPEHPLFWAAFVLVGTP